MEALAANSKPLPGPAPVNTFFGLMRMAAQYRRDTLGMIGARLEEYGDTYLLQVAGHNQVITIDPELYQQVLLTQASKFHKDDDYKNPKYGLARFLGNGLVTSDGKFWKRQRRLAAPALHARRIEAYADTMVQYTLDMLKSWRPNDTIDVNYAMIDLTMRVVARSLFNAEVASEAEAVGRAVEVMQDWSAQRVKPPVWLPLPGELRVRRAERTLNAIIYRIIDERRATGDDRGDLLSMLLLAEDEDGNRMTNKQARDEVVTLFVAGHETTSNLLSWTWYLLAKNPDVAAKLHRELDTVLAGRAPTLHDLANLPYTEMVIKESLRLYAPVWGVGREAIEDVQLGEYLIPKGTVVGLLFYFTHRDPRWFADPTRFLPERFSPENEKRIPKYAYLPFGAGPRICIGNSFALMEARLMLATIASRYRLELRPGQQVTLNPRITLGPKGGLPMLIRERQHSTAAYPEPHTPKAAMGR